MNAYRTGAGCFVLASAAFCVNGQTTVSSVANLTGLPAQTARALGAPSKREETQQLAAQFDLNGIKSVRDAMVARQKVLELYRLSDDVHKGYEGLNWMTAKGAHVIDAIWGKRVPIAGIAQEGISKSFIAYAEQGRDLIYAQGLLNPQLFAAAATQGMTPEQQRETAATLIRQEVLDNDAYKALSQGDKDKFIFGVTKLLADAQEGNTGIIDQVRNAQNADSQRISDLVTASTAIEHSLGDANASIELLKQHGAEYETAISSLTDTVTQQQLTNGMALRALIGTAFDSMPYSDRENLISSGVYSVPGLTEDELLAKEKAKEVVRKRVEIIQGYSEVANDVSKAASVLSKIGIFDTNTTKVFTEVANGAQEVSGVMNAAASLTSGNVLGGLESLAGALFGGGPSDMQIISSQLHDVIELESQALAKLDALQASVNELGQRMDRYFAAEMRELAKINSGLVYLGDAVADLSLQPLASSGQFLDRMAACNSISIDNRYGTLVTTAATFGNNMYATLDSVFASVTANGPVNNMSVFLVPSTDRNLELKQSWIDFNSAAFAGMTPAELANAMIDPTNDVVELQAKTEVTAQSQSLTANFAGISNPIYDPAAQLLALFKVVSLCRLDRQMEPYRLIYLVGQHAGLGVPQTMQLPDKNLIDAVRSSEKANLEEALKLLNSSIVQEAKWGGDIVAQRWAKEVYRLATVNDQELTQNEWTTWAQRWTDMSKIHPDLTNAFRSNVAHLFVRQFLSEKKLSLVEYIVALRSNPTTGVASLVAPRGRVLLVNCKASESGWCISLLSPDEDPAPLIREAATRTKPADGSSLPASRLWDLPSEQLVLSDKLSTSELLPDLIAARSEIIADLAELDVAEKEAHGEDGGVARLGRLLTMQSAEK